MEVALLSSYVLHGARQIARMCCRSDSETYKTCRLSIKVYALFHYYSCGIEQCGMRRCDVVCWSTIVCVHAGGGFFLPFAVVLNRMQLHIVKPMLLILFDGQACMLARLLTYHINWWSFGMVNDAFIFIKHTQKSARLLRLGFVDECEVSF